jgi:hypothetical protein
MACAGRTQGIYPGSGHERPYVQQQVVPVFPRANGGARSRGLQARVREGEVPQVSLIVEIVGEWSDVGGLESPLLLLLSLFRLGSPLMEALPSLL